MAEDAEDIGGIQVSVGASHARLPGDLEAANRILDAWAQQAFTVQLRAQVQQAAPTRPAAAPAPPTVAFGPGTRTQAQAQQSQTALQRAINAELGKTGEIYNSQTGEIESATKATVAQRQAVIAVQQQAAAPARLNIDTEGLQTDLQAILATLREITAQTAKVASTPISRAPRAVSDVEARRLRELTYEAQASQGNAPTSATFAAGGRTRTPAEIERFRAEGAARANATASQARVAARPAYAEPAPVAIDAVERQRLAQIREREEFGRGRGGASALTDEDFARRAEQRIASSEARAVAAGRTARTTASGFGGQFLFGGPARQQAEATARQTEAEQRLVAARRRLFDPAIERNARAYRHATEEVTVAENDLAKATAKVASLSGFGTAARSLAAVTVAGAAFGAGLQAISFAVSTIGPALGDAIDQAAGFGAVSNKVTQNLAQQTIAARGNVNAVLAQAEAQAGLSTAAADAVDNQIKLTTQIKAGAIAAAQQGGLFRAAIGANQQTPQGLLGGFGGIGGGAFLGQQLGGGAGFAETIKSTFGDFTRATQDILHPDAHTRPSPFSNSATPGQLRDRPTLPTDAQVQQVAQIAKDRAAAEDSLNEAAKRGAIALGSASGAAAHFGSITAEQAQALQSTNLPQELKDLAKDSNEALIGASGDLVTSFKDATTALEQAAAGLAIPDQATFGRIASAQEQQRQREAQASIPALRAQQAFNLPSQINAIGRNAGFAVGTQQPVQQALGAFANPNVPVGTGIAAQDRARVSAGLKEAQGLQDQLNAKYAEGQQIIEDTYRPAILQNFGQAALQTFDTALATVKATGQQIASISANLSNEQAAYQVAQYNFQLQIAKRNLSDIGGLTDHNFGAGESYLGVLERQNLALSRQAQQLQFGLSQRQINFQTALAGFQAPGVTPEERQARIKEAQIEAGFAQKQLDISKQIFGNQVQIVDINNLRQGADLAKQIGLLTQGRKVTIDTAAAEQRLLRLQQLQQQAVARAGTYITAVDNVVSIAFANIQQLEAAYGGAIAGITRTTLDNLNVYLTGLSGQLTSIFGRNALGGQSGGRSPDERSGHAAGGLYTTAGRADITVGEAGAETVAILRNPRAGTGFGGSGVTNIFHITGNTIRNDNDLDTIVRRVTQALGREASIKGLRGVG